MTKNLELFKKYDDINLIKEAYNHVHKLIQKDERYTAVFFAHDSTVFSYLGLSLKAYYGMDYYLHKNVKAVYVIHTDWMSKVAIRTLLSIASPKFTRKFRYLNSISDLNKYIPLSHLKLPPIVYEFDRNVEPAIFPSNPSATSNFIFPVQQWTRPPDALVEGMQVVSKSLQTEGLFRKSCSRKHLDIVIELYDNGCMVDLEAFGPIAACSLIKHLFRSLPSPLFSAEFLNGLTDHMDSGIDYAVSLQKLIDASMDKNSQKLARLIFSLLYQITQHEQENMMNAQNLALCIGPSFSKADNIAELMSMKDKEYNPYCYFLEYAILHWNTLFANEENWDSYIPQDPTLLLPKTP